MLCVTGVYLRDITNMIFAILLLNVNHLSVCSSCLFIYLMFVWTCSLISDESVCLLITGIQRVWTCGVWDVFWEKCCWENLCSLVPPHWTRLNASCPVFLPQAEAVRTDVCWCRLMVLGTLCVCVWGGGAMCLWSYMFVFVYASMFVCKCFCHRDCHLI